MYFGFLSCSTVPLYLLAKLKKICQLKTNAEKEFFNQYIFKIIKLDTTFILKY